MTTQSLLNFAGCTALALALTACGSSAPEPSSESPVIETRSPQQVEPQEIIEPQSVDVTTASVGTSEADSLDSAALLKRGRIVWFKCRACHETDVGRPHKVGPNLHGLFGEPAAAQDDFSYSASLSESGIIWNDETLDAFINKPADYVKGTTMAFIGINRASDRQAVIEYLRQETASK